MTKLKEIYIIAPKVTDLSPISKMKNIESLSIHCDKTANIKPVLDAKHIKRLTVNGTTYQE
ncbi:hypothetical protein [Fusobacterium sp. PH5-44]|uniref:hypothetical protein n=1 Tax=unclassified Fusobacterium TaxID=2648384 RepID=UPI003D23052C